MLSPEEVYVMDLDALHTDLYRMGNATSPNFSEGRGLRDCRTYEKFGIKFVVADVNGFSDFDKIIAAMRRPGIHVWKIKKNSPLPTGLRLAKDLTNPGHYMLVPTNDMPLKKYLGLLEEIAANPQITEKLTTQEIQNAR